VYKDDGATLIKFGFKCNCSKEILASGGQQMLDELYAGKFFFLLRNSCQDYKLPASENLPDFDITLGIDSSKLPKTQSKRIVFIRYGM
jgi:hypothetical protein